MQRVRGGGDGQKVKGGQAQGPLVKNVHIPLLSEGIQANPGLLRQRRGLITKISIKDIFAMFILIVLNNQLDLILFCTCGVSSVSEIFCLKLGWDYLSSLLILVSTRDI